MLFFSSSGWGCEGGGTRKNHIKHCIYWLCYKTSITPWQHINCVVKNNYKQFVNLSLSIKASTQLLKFPNRMPLIHHIIQPYKPLWIHLLSINTGWLHIITQGGGKSPAFRGSHTPWQKSLKTSLSLHR